MKKLRFLTFILASGLLYPLSMLNAQSEFYAFDFTSEEGLVDGPVVDQDPDGTVWSAWNNNGDVTWFIDTSGTGSLIVDPEIQGFQTLKYVGFGFELIDNAYYGEVKMMLKYEVGASSGLDGVGATTLPSLAFRGLNDASKFMVFGMRHTGDNTFNYFCNSGPVGGWQGAFAPGFTGEDIGLAVDEAGLWTDGESDELLIRFSLVNTEADAWLMTSTVYNLTTGTAFETITLDVTDGDGSFTSQDHFFEFQPDNMYAITGATYIDSFSINFAPLPDVEMPAMWAGYPVDELGWVDTGTWMGFLNVIAGDWVWSASLATYIYLPESLVSPSGAWTYIPGN